MQSKRVYYKTELFGDIPVVGLNINDHIVVFSDRVYPDLFISIINNKNNI